MEKVFVDTDIVIDLLSGRKPHYKFAAEIFSMADLGMMKIHLSSLTFANVYYILTRQTTASQTRKMLLKFKSLVLSAQQYLLTLA